jgi:ferrous iron transport protein B
MYLMGILVAVLSAILFKKTILRGASANYMMELPEYRMPSAKNMWLHTWERSKGFLIKAGTVLLGAFIIIWFLSYFGIVDGSFRLLSDTEISNSLLGIIGRAIQPIFRPMGIQDWQATVAMMSGFVAKESVVGTLGILYGVSGDVLENGSLLYSHIQAHFTPLQAYAYMTFALLATPCIAAVAAMKRELGSWKWLAFGIVYEMVVAYLVATAIYQIGSLGLGNALSYLLALVVIIFVYSMVRKVIRQKGKTCSHCTGCSLSSSCTLPQKEVYLNKEGAKLDEPTSK